MTKSISCNASFYHKINDYRANSVMEIGDKWETWKEHEQIDVSFQVLRDLYLFHYWLCILLHINIYK